MTDLPEATANPCDDCPWRRKSLRGWLGPLSAEEWLEVAHSDAAIACHRTMHRDGWDQPGVKQCRGAAIFRENVFKLPRDPAVVTGPRDTERVFASNDEFRQHHASPLADHLAARRDDGHPGEEI